MPVVSANCKSAAESAFTVVWHARAPITFDHSEQRKPLPRKSPSFFSSRRAGPGGNFMVAWLCTQAARWHLQDTVKIFLVEKLRSHCSLRQISSWLLTRTTLGRELSVFRETKYLNNWTWNFDIRGLNICHLLQAMELNREHLAASLKFHKIEIPILIYKNWR